VLLVAIAFDAQAKPKPNEREKAARPAAASSGITAAKVPVVIVGTAARLTWATTKFTAQHFEKPVAKAVFLQATPAITKFALKNSGKYLLPFATKLSLL
jgi:hypothetical protein